MIQNNIEQEIDRFEKTHQKELDQMDFELQRENGTRGYLDIINELGNQMHLDKDRIPEGQICEYKKPFYKYSCKKEATLIIPFNVGKAYVCRDHFMWFCRKVLPYAD